MTLDQLVLELRRELRQESWIGRLHGRGVAEGFNEELDAKGWVRSPDEGGIGRPFSGPMWRLLGSPDDWGTAYLARASVQEISDRCHGRHRPNHERPGDRYGLCARLTFRVVEMGQPVAFAAERMGLELEAAEGILTTALTHAANWRAKRLDDLRHAARVESHDLIPQEQFIADHDSTEWERQKWEGIREGYHLPPWEIEWERRMAQHAKYGCSRCERIAA